jgi:hypothetical protein
MSKGCEVRFLLVLKLVEEASRQPLPHVSEKMPTIYFQCNHPMLFTVHETDRPKSITILVGRPPHDQVRDHCQEETTSEAGLTGL